MDFFEIFAKIGGTTAFIIGGVWAYYKYIRGRLFHPRIESFINGELVYVNSLPHLLLKYEIKNIGLSKVELNNESSAIRVMQYRPQKEEDPLKIESVHWHHIGSFSILEKHSWIESSEIIKEDRLFSISEILDIVYKAEIRIVGKGKSWDSLDIIFCNK